jgi:hypothetical protein
VAVVERGVGALVDVVAPSAVALEARVARAIEVAVLVGTRRVRVAVVRAGGGEGRLKHALVDVGAEEAVARIPHRCAVALVPCASCKVGARGARVAIGRTRRALVQIVAAHAVARVARGARAREGAGEVGAVRGVEAVVRASDALVDLGRRGRVGARV